MLSFNDSNSTPLTIAFLSLKHTIVKGLAFRQRG
nr:MAG TPA: hypothetical protein [Caudoviricetes sp.]